MNSCNEMSDKRVRRLSSAFAVLILSGVLAACGGGGSSTAVGSDSNSDSGASSGGGSQDASNGGSGGTTGSSGSGSAGSGGTGTGSSGSGSAGTPGSSGSMKITALDGPVSRNPVAGVSVTLHNTDDRTIAQTIVTGADGVADFGAIASGNASLKSTPGRRSVSIAAPQNVSGFDVTTIVNLNANAYDFFVGTDDTSTSCVRRGTLANGTFTMPNALTGAVWPLFAGQSPIGGGAGFAGGQVTGGTLTVTNVPVCEHHLQPDGTLTLLVIGGDATGQTTSYGFFTGLAVSDAMTVQGDASRQLGTLPWTATTTHVPELIGNANLSGSVFFPIISENNNGASSGTLPFADQLPFGSLVVTGTSSGFKGADSCAAFRSFTSPPTTVSITMPDFGAVGRTFEGSPARLNLTLPGPDTADLQILSPDVSEPNSSWTIIAAGTATQIQIPDLPAAVNIGTVAPENSDISLIDLGQVNGFDEAVALFLQTNDRAGPGALAGFGDSTFCAYPFLTTPTGGAGPGAGNNGGATGGGATGSTGGGAGGTGGTPAGGASAGLLTVAGGALAGTFAPGTGSAQDIGGAILSISWSDAAGNMVAVFPDSTNTTNAALVSITPVGGSVLISSAATGALPVTVDYGARTVTFSGVDVQGSVLTGTLGF